MQVYNDLDFLKQYAKITIVPRPQPTGGPMKPVGVLVLAIITFVAPAHAADPWSRQDIALQGVYLVVKALDLGQTLNIVSRPEEYHEINPILGRHPSKSAVYAYFLTTTMIHIGITHFLPARCRPWFQGISIAIQGGVVMHNHSIGLRVRF